MSDNFFRVNKGITLNPSDAPITPQEGQIYHDISDDKTKVYGKVQTVDVSSSNTIELDPTITVDPLSGISYATVSSFNSGISYETNTTNPFFNGHKFLINNEPILNVQYSNIEIKGPSVGGAVEIDCIYDNGTKILRILPEYSLSTLSDVTVRLPNTVYNETLVGRQTVDTFENKTYDTAATGNVFKVNGTQLTAVTGTGSVVLDTSPTLTTPNLGTPSNIVLTNATGLPVGSGISGFGTGVAVFLETPTSANLASAITDETGSGALVFANTPTLITPILGTPTSGTLSNCTGLPIDTGVSGLASGIATFLATPTSANLAAAITNETGSGLLVFNNSPTFITPILDSATATSITGGASNDLTINSSATHNIVLKNNGSTTATVTSSGISMNSGKTLTVDVVGNRVLISNSSGVVSSSSVTDTTLGYLDATSSIQTQLNAKQATITGAATTITTSDLTASRAIISNASGKVAVSSVTDTELGYVSGVTSAIQTQINSKQDTITGAASTITSSNLTASRALTSNASGKVTVSSVTDTELGYVSGVTSTIQTQLNAKQATLVSGSNINTVNGNSLLGATDIPFVLPYSQISMYAANPNSTTLSAFNGATLSITGTGASKLTGSPAASSTLYAAKTAIVYTGTSLSSSSISGWRQAQTQYYMGPVQYGGLRFVTEFGFTDCFASGGINRRFFTGLTRAATSPSDLDPSTQFTDFFGIGFDKNDAQWQFMCNDGSGAATKVALGASFARPTTDPSDWFRVELIAAKNSSTVTYILTNISTGATVTGSVSTNLPSPAVGNFALAGRAFISAGAVATTATMATSYIYIEQY